MKLSFKGMIVAALAGLAYSLSASQAWSAEPEIRVKPSPAIAEQVKFFESEVLPILQANCFPCHGGDKKAKGGLRLSSRETILAGGNNGPAVALEKPEQSLLLQAVNYREPKMPPKGKLPQAQINVLTRWVQMGIPWPAAGTSTTRKRHGPPPVDEQAKQFWSFRAVTHPALPAVRQRAWVRNPIDTFVLAKLEAAGLEPAPPADKQDLLRRVTYDLIGLPPSPAEIDAFCADKSPDAYERAVDRLLASPHYGEHWARHWLDLVRYAESNSFERDGAKPNVWRYRDYVIRALNEDKPYDQFIREQLAGDELDTVTADGLIATGYYRLGQWDDEPVDPVQALYDDLDDLIATTGQVFLGLTVNCARCHDHKIDPFPQKDYYRLLAFFHGIQRYGVRSPETVAKASLRPITSTREQERQHEEIAVHQKKLSTVREQVRIIEAAIAPRLAGGERDDFKHEANRLAILQMHVPDLLTHEAFDRYYALRTEQHTLEKNRPGALAEALCVTEIGCTPRETFVLLRGNPQAKGEKVEPGFPSVLPAMSPPPSRPRLERLTSGRRRVLADWIASPQNPLTTRVLANRLWQYHFGRGIVRSSSNFGYQGTPPTHPELLDWLASEFVACGWRLKAMHKLLVMSNTFRMSSRPNPKKGTVPLSSRGRSPFSDSNASAQAKDPENDLYWHFDPRRLAAEEIRDSILAVCGNLNCQKLGGPSVYPVIPREVLAGQSMPGAGWGNSTPEDQNRRSIYIHIKRSLAVPLLAAFDAADTDASCPVRFTTTQPAQALGMLNSDFVNEQAKVFAEDLRHQAGADPAAQIHLALRRTLQREPSAAEVERGVKFIQRMRKEQHLAPEEALRFFCLLALNLNEFIYLD
jgi:mono/diheme cytochrome c family protein